MPGFPLFRSAGYAWVGLVVLLAATAGSAAGQSVDSFGEAAFLPSLDPTRPLGQFNLTLWTEREGLPQNFVSSLAQTPDGYLWAGSERGLIRFDGVRFTVFTPENTPGLKSPWVTALAVGPDGTLWIGTGGSGVVRFRDGDFVPIKDESVVQGPLVSALVVDGSGDLWVGTEGRGLFRISDGGEVTHPVGSPEGLVHDYISALALDVEGVLWVATPQGVDRVEVASGRVLGPHPALEGVQAQSLLADPPRGLWVGTGGRGLRLLSGEDLLPVPGAEQLGGAFVVRLFLDRAGALWVGTNGSGLFRYWDGVLSRLPSRPESPTDLVRDVLEDREGNLWLGLVASGLARLQDGVFGAYGMPEGMSMNVALALLEARDGSLWVGTPGGGVNRIRPDGVTVFGLDEGLGSAFVFSVSEAPDGAVWLGTGGGGVARIHDGRVESFGVEDGLLSAQVSVVHHTSDGALWLGYRGQGLHRWRSGPPRVLTVEEGLPNASILTVLEDGDGVLWVGTRSGLGRVDGEEVTALGTDDGLPHGHITGLYGDGNGGLWVATMGGVARIRDGVVFAFHTGHGLPDLEPMAIVEDEAGYLWMSTNQGLLQVPREAMDRVADGAAATVEVRRFGRAHGLRSTEANGGIHPAAWVGREGFLYFPTMGGVVQVDPTRTVRPSLPPVPLVEEIRLGDAVHPASRAMRLPRGVREVEFTFSAPTFVASEEVRLRYRLEGFDSDWRMAGPNRMVRYTNLPPGTYRFLVESSRADEEWTGSPAFAQVTLPRYLHEQWWVRLLAVLGVLGGLWGGYHLRLRRLHARGEELRRAQKMEAVGRLAGGVAHDFNNLLTVIGMNARLVSEALPSDSPVQEELAEVVRASDRAAGLTRQLLAFSRKQALHPGWLNLNEVVLSVERLLRRVLRSHVVMETRLDPELPRVWADEGGMEQVLVNLLMNAQDAMPEGGRVVVSTQFVAGNGDPMEPVLRGPHVVLTVSDEGKGMDAATMGMVFEPFFTTKRVGEGTGLGLASVYGIVQQTGGRVEVASELGKGSTFRIHLPVAKDSAPGS